jgi:hypothetical protein
MKLTTRKNIPRFASAFLLAVAAVMPARAADYQSTVQSYDPVGYWRFDETAASPPLNIISNLSALGGVANGYCVGGPSKGESGIIGTSIRFNNPNVLSDVGYLATKIDVPWNAALNPNPPFSVEFWAKPNVLTADSTGYCPLSNFDPNFSGGSRAGWLFYINSAGRWQWKLGNRGGYAGILNATNGFASSGAWQHIVATWDGATANLYVNGVLAGSTPVSVANWVDNPQSFLRFGGTELTGTGAEAPTISATSNNGNRGFDGWLEEAAIYTNVLSPATISAHYSAAATNNAGYNAQILADNPVGYWPMNDPAVTVPASFPVAVNIGSLGSAANGTNYWGALAGQSGPGYAGFGAADKAVFFDGDNGYFQINDTPGIHITNTITMTAWIKPTEQDFFRDIIEHGFDPVTSAETFLRISRSGGADGTGDGNYYEVGSTDGSSYYDSALFPIPTGDIGNWVFLAGTYDGTNWNLYRNGLLVGSAPATGVDTGAIDVTNLWTIGSRGVDGSFVGQGEFFGGTIDEPAIFTNALADADIAILYNAALVPPVITQAPQNPGTAFRGSTVSFSVWAEGSPTLGYLWTSNGVPTGVTSTNYSISDISVGTYTIAVIVTNAYGTNTASVTFPAINAPPSIITPPAPTTRFAGYPFVLSVTAGGTTPLTYYWMRGNTLVQAGPSSTYSNLASVAIAGNYSVIISNLTGINATSPPVALTVNPIPGGYAGGVISSSPIAYWRLGETNGNIAHDGIGGNDGTYFNVTLGVTGYSVIDSDTAVTFSGLNSYVGNISGSSINFTGHTNFTLEAWVNAPAGLADQSTIIAKGIGNSGTTETEQFAMDVAGGVYRFFVSRGTTVNEVDATEGPNGSWQHVVGVYDDLNVLGNGPTMYIYVNGVSENTHGTLAAGLNGTVTPVSIGSKRTGNDPNYDGTFAGTIDEVAVYNAALDAGTIQAHYAAAYGNSLAPAIFVQPSPVTNYAGLPATLSVVAAGTVPLSYQWNKGNVGLSDGGNITGANSDKLTIAPLTYGDAGNYSVSIVNSVRGTNSVAVPLVVLPPPTNPPAIVGLVMHLTFDTNLVDATGRANNGTGMVATATSTNAVAPNPGNPSFTYVSDGALGTALHYSTEAYNTGGTTSIGTNDFYVTLGVRPDLQFGANVSFTVAYWVRLPLFVGGDLPFFTDAAGSEGNNGFVFAPAYGYGTADPNPNPAPQNYGGWAASIYGAGNGVRLYGDLGSINNPNPPNWFSLVHVVNRAAGTVVTYLNGAVAHYSLISGTTLTAAGNIDTGLPATIGQDPTGRYGETGSADIDDLGVWRRALTPLEAASIYIAAVSNQLSFASAPIILTPQPSSASQLKLSWPAGDLESSTNVLGPYTPVSGAVSPYTTATTNGMVFYRVKL